MPVTLTDQQAQQVRQAIDERNQAQNALRSVQEIWNDPELGDHAKALWKKKFPDSPIEGYDAKLQVQGVVDKFEADRKKEKEDAELKALTDRSMAQRKEVQDRRGYTDDAMKRMEDMMRDKHIYDYEAADLLFAAREPKPSNVTADYNSHFWNHDKQPAFKEIAADPERWGFEEIVKAARSDQEQRNRF